MESNSRNVIVPLVILLLVVAALSSTMGGMMGPGMMGRGGGWMWGVGMWPAGLLMLVFWGALIVGAVLVMRFFEETPAREGADVRTSPLDILKRRYASGEVTREQYEQIRKDLEP
jgi:putative membrane protein